MRKFASGDLKYPRARGFNLCASVRISSHMWPIEEIPTSPPCDKGHVSHPVVSAL